MAKNLSLKLLGEGNLSSELNDIAESAGNAADALERAQSAVSGINDDMQAAKQAASKLEEKLEEVGQSGWAGAAGVDKLGDEARGATIQASTLNIVLDEAADSSINLAGSARTAASGVNSMEEEMDEAKGAGLGLAASVAALSGASASGVPIQQVLANSLDNTADQADDAAGSMLKASGAAELLNLQSSALSINLGPFTVALRSLTTQVPLLVASLGNLTTAMAGVGGVIGSLGLGGLGVAIGGAVAHAEEIAGPMATMEEKMQAMAAIGKEFMSMMRKAIDPLVKLEGSAALFKSLLEEIATTVRVFSEAIADSFRNGPLRNSLAIISDAWMQNIEEIGDAFQGMVDELGPRFANLIADFIAALPGFINWVTRVTDEVMDIFGQLDGVLQPFIVEFTELGRNVADGLVPVLAIFFDVMAGVAEALNESGGEAVTTAAKIVGLLFAINRLGGIAGNLILPLSSVAGSLIGVASNADRFSEAFFKATSNFTTFMSEAVSGFGRLATAFTGFLPMVEESGGALGFLASSLEEANEETKTLSQSVKKSLGVFDGMVQRSTLGDTGFLTSGFEGLTSRVGAIKQSMLGASVGGGELRDSLSEVRDSARSVASTTTVSANSVDDLRHDLMVAARTSDMTTEELEAFSDELQEMSLSAEVADGTVRELGEELEDAGVDAAVASKLTDSYNEELASTSWRAGIAAKANAALSTSFSGVGTALTTTLLPALGALAAAFAVLVLVGGAVTAALAMIGESGKSAEEITRTLKDAFMTLVDAVLPFFLQSAEFVIELVKSITAVFGELVSAGEDVAVALGLMEESTDNGASGFEGFVNSVSGFVETINPVIDAIGDFIRWTAGYMIIAIRNTADAFIDFINIMHAPAIIQTIISGAKGIANSIGGIENVMKGVVKIVGAFISGLIKLTAILAIVGTVAGIAALGVGGFAAALWSAIAGLVTISAPISGLAAVIGALIVAVVVILEYLGVFDIILGVIASAFGLVMDAIMAAIGAIVAAGEAIFNFLRIGKAISFLTSVWDAFSAGINKVVNALKVVFRVVGKVVGVFKKMAMGIINLLVKKAIGALVSGVKMAWKWLQKLWKSFVNLIMSVPLVGKLFKLLKKGFNEFIKIVQGLIDTILNFPKHIKNAFNAVVGYIEGFVNTYIDAINKIIDGYNSIPGVDDIDKLDKVELTAQGKEAGRAVKDAKESAGDAAPDDVDVSEDDAGSGLEAASNMRDRDGQEAPSGETPGRMEYKEGDTMNQYNQDISADPEDKAQMSRIAKDAMEEANSFARRQQGGQ